MFVPAMCLTADVVCVYACVVSAGIFFKFARDVHGVYGGNQGAAKSANHEIRSLQAIISCNVRGLNVPLMVTIDYLCGSVGQPTSATPRFHDPLVPCVLCCAGAIDYVQCQSFPSATRRLYMAPPTKDARFTPTIPWPIL